MILMEEFHIQDLVNCSPPKPRKISIREEVLLVFNKKPKTKMIDIRHFSQRSGYAKR